MLNLTANEMVTRRKDLEQSAALTLGKMLFAFSRLDMNLGLILTGIFWGVEKNGPTKNLDAVNFNSRLELLASHIEGSSSLSGEAKSELKSWILSVHAVREKRNEMVHGRWGSDVLKNKVLNVVGLPSSDSQRTIEYSLADLEAHNQEIERLTSELSRLRTRWKLA